MGNTLTFDIGGTAIKYALFDQTGKPGQFFEVPTQAREGGQVLMEKVMDLAADFDFSQLGISTCGQVDRDTGSIIYANDNVPNYTGTQIKQLLEGRYHVPVAVENDVNAAALGEAFYGSAQDFNSFLCVTFGTGIGGAIVIDRKVFSGLSGSAGEFGHMITHVGGKHCNCGLNGCYERYASTSALIKTIEEKMGLILDGRQIFEYFHKGNAIIGSIVDRWLNEITIGLVGLIHIFNPACIVIGGGIMTESYVVRQLQQRVLFQIMPSYKNVKLVQARLGNRAGLYGAYYLANQQIDNAEKCQEKFNQGG